MPATVINYADPVITETAQNTLKSNFTTGNHWYLDGEPLTDTTSTLKIKVSGTYRLEVKIKSCTASVEGVFSFTVIAGLDDPTSMIKAYPNPTAGMLSLEVSDAKNEVGEAPVINALGATIGTITLTRQGNRKKGQFDFGPLPAGLYYIRVGSDKEGKIVKVIRK